MDLGLKGKKAIVSGGTKGIGRAIAETLAAEGCDIAICSRNGGEVEAAVQALSGKGVRATGAALDVGDGPALKKWVADAAAELGGLDIVVPNVSALAVAATEDSWRQEFQVDMMGTVNMVEAALPFLEQSEAAAIVVISSVSGVEVDFAAGPYGAMKAALIYYAASLSCQLAPKGIRANTVSPGNTYFKGGVWHRIETDMPDLFASTLAANKMGRMATPEEVANAVVFLASPAASFVTGTNLLVDGALTNGVQY